MGTCMFRCSAYASDMCQNPYILLPLFSSNLNAFVKYYVYIVLTHKGIYICFIVPNVLILLFTPSFCTLVFVGYCESLPEMVKRVMYKAHDALLVPSDFN